MDPRDASASKNENVAQIGGRPAQIDVDSNLGNAQNKGCFFLGSLHLQFNTKSLQEIFKLLT